MDPKYFRRGLRTVCWIAGGFTILSALIYIIRFHASRISTDTSDWANFATYFYFVLTFINTALISFLTYMVYQSQESRNAFEKDYIMAQEKPIITLVPNQTEHKVQNIGKGAAMNVVVLQKSHGPSPFTNPRKIFSMPAHGQLNMKWALDADEICVIYYDIFGGIHASLMSNNISSLLTKKDLDSRIPDWRRKYNDATVPDKKDFTWVAF